jgi:hypothetical protein
MIVACSGRRSQGAVRAATGLSGERQFFLLPASRAPLRVWQG